MPPCRERESAWTPLLLVATQHSWDPLKLTELPMVNIIPRPVARL